jgi:hypothetical protein
MLRQTDRQGPDENGPCLQLKWRHLGILDSRVHDQTAVEEVTGCSGKDETHLDLAEISSKWGENNNEDGHVIRRGSQW